jgi:hypothetical protein
MLTPVMLLCLAQVAAPVPAELCIDFRATDALGRLLRTNGRVAQDEGGVRITIPSGQGKQHSPGLVSTFGITGDFEATLSYDILQLDRPSTGYGVGVSLYAGIDPNNHHAVSLARRLTREGTHLFISNRMQAQAPRDRVRTRASNLGQGKLRLRRSGATVHFLVQEGPDPEFVELDAAEFGSSDIAVIQMGANAGNSDAGLDVRLLDFSLHTATPVSVVDPLPIEGAAAAPSRLQPPWRLAVVLILLALLAAGGVAAWRLRSTKASRRHSKSPRPAGHAR